MCFRRGRRREVCFRKGEEGGRCVLGGERREVCFRRGEEGGSVF